MPNYPTEKSLAVLRFVDEHTASGDKPHWTNLTRLWNEQHPEMTYVPRSRGFRKSYDNAKRFIERVASHWTQKAEGGGQTFPHS